VLDETCISRLVKCCTEMGRLTQVMLIKCYFNFFQCQNCISNNKNILKIYILLGCSADPVQSGPQLCPGETGIHCAFGHISEVASNMEEIVCFFLSRGENLETIHQHGKFLRQSINMGIRTESPPSQCSLCNIRLYRWIKTEKLRLVANKKIQCGRSNFLNSVLVLSPTNTPDSCSVKFLLSLINRYGNYLEYLHIWINNQKF